MAVTHLLIPEMGWQQVEGDWLGVKGREVKKGLLIRDLGGDPVQKVLASLQGQLTYRCCSKTVHCM